MIGRTRSCHERSPSARRTGRATGSTGAGGVGQPAGEGVEDGAHVAAIGRRSRPSSNTVATRSAGSVADRPPGSSSSRQPAASSGTGPAMTPRPGGGRRGCGPAARCS